MSQGSKMTSRQHVHVRCDDRGYPAKILLSFQQKEGRGAACSNRKKALSLWQSANMRIGGWGRCPGRERGYHTKSSAIDWAPISMERLLS